MEIKERLKKLGKMLDTLKGNWIFVEGKRDRVALEGLGLSNILTISGNLRQSCAIIADRKPEKVYVLTDLDRRGDELALRARDELESCSIRADLEMRRELAHMLRIRYFEDAKTAYEKILKESEEGY
ncbi:MAG: toprim domain-containing protein [Candidatus Micrarchaeota archaeon]